MSKEYNQNDAISLSATPLSVIGDFAWDVMIRTNSELLTGGDTFGDVVLAPGGSAANVSVWAARCGLETNFIGKIGRDRLGDLAKEDLQGEGVRAFFIETDSHLTASVAVWIDHKGERSMVSGQGADFYLLASELPRAILRQSEHLHLTAWSFFTDPPRSALQEAAHYAKQNGATLSLDPASFQLIGEMGIKRFVESTKDLDIDIFFPNYQEGQAISEESEPKKIAEKLSELYPTALIVLKLDAKGAFLYKQDAVGDQSDLSNGIRIPASDSHLIDATGAGDSFAGSFLAKYLQGASAKEAAIFATQVSGWVIEHLGARPKADVKLNELLSTM